MGAMTATHRARLTRCLGWLLAPMLLFLPLLVLPRVMVFGNWDALFYGNVLALTSDALRHGEIYTRWFSGANAAMGSTVMMFYAPLAYISTALIEFPLAGLDPDLGTRFALGIYASQVLCGVTAFTWLKRHFPARTAFMGSLLYVLLPYKFIYIYEHLNLAQLWALAFLPLWMLAAEKLAAGGGARAAALYALAGAATYYCHPLTVIAFGAVPACYALWFARRRAAAFGWLALACGILTGLCLMLASTQWQDLGWIHAEGFLSGKFDWRGNLYHVDVLLCAYYGFIAALVAWAAVRCPAIGDCGRARPSLFWAAVVAAVAFMSLPISAFLWERVPILKYLQFPAGRLHSAALMAVVFLICVWLEHHREMRQVSRRVYRRAMLAALIAVFAVATGANIAEVYGAATSLTQPYIDAARAAHIIFPTEYKTRWGCVDPGRALALYRANRVPAPVTAEEGAAAILREWHPPRRIVFTADVKAAQAGITVRQCYVPVWQAFDAGQSVPLDAIGPDGLIHMTLPRGPHTVELRLVETPSMAHARLASAASLALCLLLLWKGPDPERGKPGAAAGLIPTR
jgi:hypothetical protein